MSAVLTPVPRDHLDASADRPQSGDVPRRFFHKDGVAEVLLGDSARLGERDIDTKQQANLIVTSPPYSLGVDYGQAGYADDQPYVQYLEWVRTWAKTLLEVSQQGGRACINIPLDSNKGGKRAIYADYLRI